MIRHLTLADPAALYSRLLFSESTAYGYTGSDQSFIVPAGVTTVRAKVWGGGGGGAFVSGAGGGGGFAQAEFAVTAGETLTIKVGGAGEYANATNGGWSDGGAALWSS